jgi:hypothetical protein
LLSPFCFYKWREGKGKRKRKTWRGTGTGLRVELFIELSAFRTYIPGILCILPAFLACSKEKEKGKGSLNRKRDGIRSNQKR